MVEDKDIKKTGTTTVGIVCKDGIVLCADKRVTSGYLISYKKFKKIAQITDNIAVTVAGSVSDVQLTIKIIKAELQLKKIRTGSDVTVKEAVNLLSSIVYGNIRQMSMIPSIAHFIIAGKDDEGFHCYDLSPDGSIIECDEYVSSGSGSVMAYGVLETLYKPGMTVDEALKLGAKAINAAVQRDIASGNGIDIVTVTKEGVKKVISKEIEYKIEI
ncbi:MAG: proteasome subunit beta [Nanoarchaeota archaeon]